ncbi:hypothetical protein [Acrocarpospora phusangensis]|nr:hypothetical protein [Acrocarpospora phusangensis]
MRRIIAPQAALEDLGGAETGRPGSGGVVADPGPGGWVPVCRAY